MATQQTALNVLLRKYGADQAALDLEENRARSAYGMSVQDLSRQQGLRKQGLDEQMADRGLAHSGIAAKQNLLMQENNNRSNQQAAMTINDALANIARKRLNAQFAMDSARYGLG